MRRHRLRLRPNRINLHGKYDHPELRGLGRAEQAFFRTLAEGEGPISWAEVAADAGYADQSHLCRETRRVTGFAPAELRRRIAQDEAFWIYRIWT